MTGLTTRSKKATSGKMWSFIAVWVCLSVASISWAFSTPLAASPDEPAHIIKAAAVAQGELVGEITDQAAVTLVHVPQSVAQASAWPCFAFQENVSASCIPETEDGLAVVEATTSAGLYNPTYYFLVGWPSLFTGDGATAVYLMRIVSAIIVCFFLTICWAGLKSIAGTLIGGVSFFAIATPMVFFLTGVVNPNALEIATGTSFFVSLLWLCRNSVTSPQRIGWLVSMASSGVLLANSRGISPYWLVLFGVIALVATPLPRILNNLKDAKFIAASIIVVFGLIVSALWIMTSGTLTAMGSFPGAGQVSPLRAFMIMVFQKTADPGLIGVFGWLDTFAPPYVYAVWCILIGGLIVVALAITRKRSLLTVIVALSCFIGGPALLQAISVQKSGFIWQGRYSLAVMAVLIITCAMALKDSLPQALPGRLELRVSIIASLVFITGQISAFISALGRYVTGNSGAIFSALGAGEWNPPYGAKLWTFLAVAAFLALTLMWIMTIRKAAGQAAKDSPEYQVVTS